MKQLITIIGRLVAFLLGILGAVQTTAVIQVLHDTPWAFDIPTIGSFFITMATLIVTFELLFISFYKL